jgi:peptidyl-dipeptidase A
MNAQTASTIDSQAATEARPLTAADAEEFLREAEERLQDLSVKASRASWVQMTYITDDTEILAAEANEALTGAATELAKQATQYDICNCRLSWRARCCC